VTAFLKHHNLTVVCIHELAFFETTNIWDNLLPCACCSQLSHLFTQQLLLVLVCIVSTSV